MASIQEKRRQRQQGHPDDNDDGQARAVSSRSIDSNTTTPFAQANSGRYAGVLGSSVGAAVGLTLIGGPIGLVAGSLVGSQATQVAMQQRQSSNSSDNPDDEILRQLDRGTQNDDILRRMDEEDTVLPRQPYRLGDLTRGIVARGKKATGRDAESPYQFGDFSRGMFSGK
jgi:hypothetical protein